MSDKFEDADPLANASRDDWVFLRRFNNITRLDQARMVLEGRGIEVYTRDDHTLQSDPLIGVAIGGARLMVPPADAEDATEALNELFGTPNPDNAHRIHRVVRKRLAIGCLIACVAGLIRMMATQSADGFFHVALPIICVTFLVAFIVNVGPEERDSSEQVGDSASDAENEDEYWMTDESTEFE